MDEKKPTYAELETRLAEAQETIRQLTANRSSVTSTALLEASSSDRSKDFTAALDSLLEGCQVIGFDWRYLYVNEAGALHGRTSPDRLIGRNIRDVYPGIEESPPWPHMKRCMEQRIPHRMETPFLFPDGEKGWFELFIQPVDEGIFILSLDITERTLVNSALQTSEEKFRSFVENVNAVVYTLSLGGYFDYVSPTCKDILGYDAEEITGRHFAELVHPDSLPDCQEFFERVIDSGEPHSSLEYRAKHKEGHWRWQTSNGTVIRDERGNIISFLGIAHDTTAHKEAEQIRRESEKRLELALNGAELGLWDWDIPSGQITLNARWVEMLGYTLEEFTPHVSQWTELLHPEDAPGVMKILDEHLQGKTEQYETEYRLRHKSGNWVWILDKGRVTERSPDGKPLRACGTHLDITARKEAEGKLRDRTTELEQIFAAIPNALVYTNANRLISHVNPAFVRIFGYSPEEVLGRTTDFLYANQEDYASQGRLRYNKDAPVSHAPFELELVRKNGEQFPAEAVGTSLKDAEGQTFGFLALVSDITDRKVAERKIRESEAILRRSEERLNDAQRIAGLGDFTWDTETNQVSWSDALFELLRYEKDEHVNYAKVNDQIHHPDDAERVNHWLTEAIESGEDRLPPNEYRLIRKDGIVINVRTVGVIHHRENQAPIVFGTIYDITERIRTERALQESQRQLTTLMSNLPGMAYRCKSDDQWTMEFVSDGCRALCGYEPEELMNSRRISYEDIILPDDRQMVRNAVNEGLRNARPFEMTYRITTANGVTKWVWEQGRGVFDERGRLVALEGFIADIDERKQAELERETIAEASRILLTADSISDVYRLLPRTLAGQLDYPIAAIELHDPVNKRMVCAGSYGIPDAEDGPLYIPIEETVSGLVATSGNAVADVDVQNRPEYRFQALRKLNARAFVCVPAIVGGRIIGTLALADTKKHDNATADLHPLQVIANHLAEQFERRKAAEELARHRDQLEELVQVRTAELEQAHKKMVQQERLATLGQLTATVSHELRNPLGTIRSSVFSIRTSLDESDKALMSILDRAERNIIRCDMIIEELLDYTRTRQVSTTPTQIDSWVEEIVSEYVLPKDISLCLHRNAGVELPIDREKLRRCLINLICNACQAMEEKANEDKKLEIETAVIDSRLEIRVADTGCGIPAEQLKRVFEPLYSTKGFGVGLGLAIVQQIVQAHGGEVNITSQVEHGTTATLQLPIPSI